MENPRSGRIRGRRKGDFTMNEFYHHGIKGQKWGVRRFQNKNGTLTSAGKARSQKEEKAHTDHTNAHTAKSITQMSNQELKERNNRLQMENQYRQLISSQSSLERGVSYVTKAATTLGTMVTLYNNADKVISIGKKFVRRGE